MWFAIAELLKPFAHLVVRNLQLVFSSFDHSSHKFFFWRRLERDLVLFIYRDCVHKLSI